MEPAEIISWALGHSFKQTGVNAYSADYEGIQYQMVLKRDHFICQRVFVNGGTENCSNVTYDGLNIHWNAGKVIRYPIEKLRQVHYADGEGI
jgi:hypothetical protein